eukprot:5409816-Amphidinium_carterae.1
MTHIVTPEDGDFLIKKGLKPLRADPAMVQLAKPVVIPEGWSDIAVQALASLWTVIIMPVGDALWVRLADGSTHHLPPFLVETMTEEQVRMFIKDKDPMVLFKDDAEDEAPCRAAFASTSNFDDPDVSRLEHHDASGLEKSSRLEESPDDVQIVSKIMDTSTTTVQTTSDDSAGHHDFEKEFHDCWSAVAQPAHVLPTQKKPKQKAQPSDKQV